MHPKAAGLGLASEKLVKNLRHIVFLAYEGGEAAGIVDAVGIAVCFVGFSTFAARTLINIHDLAVAPTHRGRGIGRMLMEAVERKARAMGACKITLEVLENNVRARSVYAEAGFVSASYGDTPGGAEFLWKPLS